MSVAKKMMKEVIKKQPEDATYAEILRELAFKQMIDKGLDDSKNGRIIDNKEMKQKISLWELKNDTHKKTNCMEKKS